MFTLTMIVKPYLVVNFYVFTLHQQKYKAMALAHMKLVLNKQSVGIKKIVPVGHYALRLDFDDGHNSGLFSWNYFAKLQEQQTQLWNEYLERVSEKHKKQRQCANKVYSLNFIGSLINLDFKFIYRSI